MSSEKEIRMGRDWAQALEWVELEAVIKRFLNVESQGNALRYYEGAVQASSLAEQLTAVSLLKETIGSIPNASNSAVQQVQGKLADYHLRLSTTVGMLSSARPVPKKLHFVWVGGGIGAIQGDYINVWKQMVGPDGYSLNLWYDSDGLLAHETNRVIVESAKASGAMSAPQDMADTPNALANRYIERARALRQQMFEHIQRVLGEGGSADQARIDLLVSAYGQDESTLKALKARNLQSLEAVGHKGILLRDIRTQLSDQPLFDIYEREISFRTNLAAASDITRLQALKIEGGTYLDADLLPSLHEKIGGVDLTGFDAEARIGVMQLLLDHNPQLLPNRGSQYADKRRFVPADNNDALTGFAKNVSSLGDIFAPFNDVLVSADGVRAGNKNSPHQFTNHTPFNGLSNALLSAHAGSAALAAIMNKIRNNYAFRDRVVEQSKKGHISLEDRNAFPELIIREMEKLYGPISDWGDALRAHDQFSQAVMNYDADGIKFGAQSAIVMSGPSAVSNGLSDFVNEQLMASARQPISDRVDLFDGFNLATEEETHHSWKDNAKTEPDWFELETKRIKEGFYNNHYKGNVNELLNSRTLTFKQGWPVIEGKPVLLTSVLQQLLDDLGEPFRRAMNDKLSGDITFNDRIALDFETRQKILAQPASELPISIGAESFGSMNEALARIAGGKLPAEQLSPLHRVVFGGLFGAPTLDQEGFAPAWKETVALAESTQDRGLFARYDLIEQTLFNRRPAMFEAGHNASSLSGQVSENSRVLKAQALAEPLSVRQWGEHVHRIETATRNEYRASILRRGHSVRERFFQAGADSVKQAPQELLVRGSGDPGRRCYPLALVMAAALESGHTTERALIGKLAIANLTPDAAETHALLHVLDELRGLPMSQFGEKTAAVNLGVAMQALEAKSSTGSLMLNTDNHSMLVSKVVEHGETSYRFYDPNFGLFAFMRAEDLQQGINNFLQDDVIARLYGLGEMSNASFDVIDLNGSSIAEKPLPSRVTVGDLLSREQMVGGRSVEPWQHHAALRVRSLSENARLGDGLARLDAQGWARQIESATTRLQAEHQLSRDFVPVFESLKTSATGQREITLVNARDAGQTRRVVTDDLHLDTIKSHLTDIYQALSVKAPRPGVVDPTDAGAVHTLNAGFAIQALLFALKDRESSTNGTTALTSAVRLHGYLSYAQLTHGIVVDVVELINLVRIAFTNSLLVAKTTSSVVINALGHVANEGVGNILQLAAVGFDIYLLANAENEAQIAQFATQLAFDSAGLVAGLGGLGASLVGAGTAAAFLGGASVILGGLAVGIGALVEGFSGILERARQVGKYLNLIDQGYRSGGFSRIDDALCISPYVVVTHLDLGARLLRYGGVLDIYAAIPHELHPPKGNPDRLLSISIRESLGYAYESTLPDAADFDVVVLPCMPHCYFGFDYKALPGSTSRREHFETALKLEYDSAGERQFWFSFYRFPSEYVLHQLIPNYAETLINVVLDRRNRFLHVPKLPRELHNYLSYEILGRGGQCTMVLAEGVRAITLIKTTDAPSMAWALSATWLAESDVKIEGARVQLGAIQVHVPDQSPLLLQLDKQSYQVDWEQGSLLISEIAIGSGGNASAAQASIRELARSMRLAGRYTTVRDFPVPYSDPLKPVYTTAQYDRNEDRFLFVRGLDPAYQKVACLGAIVDKYAYYYVPDDVLIWRTDVTTGQVNRIYRLMDPVPGSRISAFQELEGGLMRIVQKVVLRNGRDMKMTYLLGANDLSLFSVIGALTEGQKALLQRRNTVSLAYFFWDYELMVRNSKLAPFDAVSVVDYQCAPLTSITYWHEDSRNPISLWLRRDDGLVIRPNLEADSGSLILLNTQDADGDTFLFYDQRHRSLYRQRVTAQNDEPSASATKILPHEVIEVFYQEQRHIALTQDGMLFQLSRTDESQLVALSGDWLAQAAAAAGDGFEWHVSVLALAEALAADGFEVSGVQNVSGNAFLRVWCLGRRMLIADMRPNQSVQLLAQTPDKKAAWLWDSASGQVYRQPFMEPEAFAAAFANGTRLLHRDRLPAMQRVAAQWSFTRIAPEGAGLRGLTREHVWIELFEGEAPRIVGVESDFFFGLGTRQARENKLLQLIAGRSHAPVLTAGRFDDLFAWYDTSARRLYYSTVQTNGHWPAYLGVRNGEIALLYNTITHEVFSNRNGAWLVPDHDVWMYADTVSRTAQVMTIQTRDNIEDLLMLIPDGVTTLVLGLNGGMTCLISEAAWLRLDCLIIDFHQPAPRKRQLIVQLPPMDHWRITLAEGHLLLTDPDDGRSLVFRSVESAGAESRDTFELLINVSGDPLFVTLEDLMQDLEEGVSLELVKLLAKAVEA
ncbi:TcdA/TcdB pore-forming domain-containing protein [Pseudomonas lini]|uniref:TcdA/TcdB pore-forming domain-containing protein n=1 Tax=Pseudomonas lini TaxID=163011 RepID=UPI000A5805CC|nr:TcdA/TcdB pore-forming domain-containing protein [Pseudomonas lini]